MSDLTTRLLLLAEKAVDEALQLDYGDPEDRYIYRELQELRQLVQQGKEGPTDENLYDLAEVFNGDPVPAMRRALELWGRPALKPVPVSERLPEPEDCDESYQCWQWDTRSDSWTLYTRIELRLNPISTHWLPYHALPLPTK